MPGQTCGDCRLLFLLQAGHGRGQRPAFPAPSFVMRAFVMRANLMRKLGRDAPREMMAHGRGETFNRARRLSGAAGASRFETRLRRSSP